MHNIHKYLNNEQGLLVLGALNANNEDREMEQKDLKPVQLISQNELTDIFYFTKKNVKGISSMAKDIEAGDVYFTLHDGILKFDIKTKEYSDCKIGNLNDVHEITIHRNKLFIANTGNDEIVVFDTTLEEVVERIDLKNIFNLEAHSSNAKKHHFHLNQVFYDVNSQLNVLVHHVDGKQKYHEDAKLKKQGNGGIINIESKTPIQLNLKSPHTVRLVEDKYWVFDSARFKINIYTKNWKFIKAINTGGYGRGGVYNKEKSLFYAGISSIRKRYLKVFHSNNPNMIEIYNTNTFKLIDKFIVQNIEQVNNLYLVDDKAKNALLSTNKNVF